MSNNLLFRLARRYLWACGYKAVPVTPLDLTGQPLHPLAAHARGVSVRPAVTDVPVERLRGLRWLPFDRRHPFVAALRAYERDGTDRYEDSPLRAFYEAVQPRDALEAAGLLAGEAPGLVGLNAYAVPLPWETMAPREAVAHRAKIEVEEAAALGHSLTLKHGAKLFGPVDPAKGQLELDRLIAVYESIRQNGFVRGAGRDGVVEAWLLVSGMDWAMIIMRGHHRVAAAAALGLDSVPVSVPQRVVRRLEAALWAQVAAGRLTKAGALAVFDGLMHGVPPPIYQGWLEGVPRGLARLSFSAH